MRTRDNADSVALYLQVDCLEIGYDAPIWFSSDLFRSMPFKCLCKVTMGL